MRNSDRLKHMNFTFSLALVLMTNVPGAFADNGPCNVPLPSCSADVDPAVGDGAVGAGDLLAVINTWGTTGAKRPAGDCAPLPNGDCLVNAADVLMVINSWGACGAATQGACWLPSNSCTVNTLAQCNGAGGAGWVSGATCADADNDRIPGAFELNTCSVVSYPYAGTNPNMADTDGDTLKDGDELYGTIAGLNLPAMGANPMRKNAFLEIDWFVDASHTHQPTAEAIAMLVAAFANSTVTNPCGVTGIALIVDRGQGGAFTGGNLIPGGDTVVLFDSEFNDYKNSNFAANRNGYFYYSIHCHRYNSSTNGSSGVAEINGDDHIVSLQSSLSDSNVSKTIMHEFGHNLNLRHGGHENLNYKPNYNSVMNYRFQFPGVDTNCTAVGDGALDYSRGLRIALNELDLNEMSGVCGLGSIDWNGNGTIQSTHVARNINCSPNASTECGNSSGSCNDSTCELLTDHNDWAAMVFTGLQNSDLAPPEIVTCDAPRDLPRDP